MVNKEFQTIQSRDPRVLCCITLTLMIREEHQPPGLVSVCKPRLLVYSTFWGAAHHCHRYFKYLDVVTAIRMYIRYFVHHSLVNTIIDTPASLGWISSFIAPSSAMLEYISAVLMIVIPSILVRCLLTSIVSCHGSVIMLYCLTVCLTSPFVTSLAL